MNSTPETEGELIISHPRLYERDIDVLLQEEFIFNSWVAELFAKALGLGSDFAVQQCQLSVRDAAGETDIQVAFSVGGQRGVLLVENKIDAVFQPRQPERYKERAAQMIAKDEKALAFCVLVAPSLYMRTESEEFSHFDATVTYEDVAKAIEKVATPRSQYRASLIGRALEKAHKTYTMVPSENVTDLWQRVYQIARTEFAILQMPVPSNKGSNSKWLIFKAGLPPRITIDWKITKGSVELSFWRGAKHFPSSGIDLTALRAGTNKQVIGETIAIIMPVTQPPSEWTAMADGAIRDALSAACELLAFYKENPACFS